MIAHAKPQPYPFANANFTESFESLAKSIIANAATYRSYAACRTMLTRLENSYLKSGSFGSVAHLRKEAIAVIQDRCLELRVQARERGEEWAAMGR